MQLTRSIVNDTFPGIAGTQGRIFTDNAPFTIPFLNSAFRKLQRRLRNEGVTFPKKNVVLFNMVPVVQADPAVFVSIGYNGYFNGTQNFPTPALPGDCYQPQLLRQRVTGSNLQFSPMQPADGNLT